ncbi:MAG TPA: flippase activity-associated protein Agl23 [Methylomirabilota bacterium]|nr:flippase activity-associated protein Agl23 [Methylomirabilota bacterium]
MSDAAKRWAAWRPSRCAPWLALVALSLALHLWALGERSYHHDESIHSHSAYNLLTNGIYRYDPTYHGPLLYYLVAGTYAVAGDSDFTARLPIALAGVLLVAVAFSLRRPLGGRAAWWTGLLATLSPLTLYYGRFLRMDILELLTASAAAVAAWRAARGSRSAWIWFGVFSGLALATKENAYVTAALVVAVWGALAVVRGLGGALPATLGWLWQRRWGVLAAVAASVVVAVPLYTVGFTHPEDWLFPYRAVSYWWDQHSIERVAGPHWYYLPRLAAYEFLPIAAALAWAVRRGRRMRLLEWSLLLFGFASVAMYAYLGEKVAWLGVHQVWAFLPLAGLQLARTFGPLGRWWSRALATAGLAATAVVTVSASFVTDEISPNLERAELISYVQTCPEVAALAAEGVALAREGHPTVAAVSGTAGWPLTWYWRQVPTWWSEPRPDLRPPLVICEVEDQERFRTLLGPQYRGERIPRRAWWVLEHSRATLGGVLRWLVTRRPFGPIGSTDIMVFRHTGEPATAARPAEVPAALAAGLGASRARLVGEGWLAEPRGLALAADGRLAAADSALNRVLLFDADGAPLAGPGEPMDRPEGLAWSAGEVLVIADTWRHRVLLWRAADQSLGVLPEPEGGWYGPRGVAVAPDGTIAVTDTGNKRVVLYEPGAGADFAVRTLGGPGEGPGQLSEPVGVAWLGDDRLAVCDTGNRRLQVLGRDGAVRAVVELGEAWADFYSRPQVVDLGGGRLLLTDTPASSLWLVEGGAVTKLDLAADGIAPTGLARLGSTLALADASGRVWLLELDTRPQD